MTVVSFINTKRSVKCDLVVEQGVDIDIPITVFDDAGVEINYASYTALMRIRPYPDSDTVLLELSTTNNKITVGDGKITLHFTKTDTSGVTWMDGEYDLKVTSALDKTSRVMEGHFQIDPEVTR